MNQEDLIAGCLKGKRTAQRQLYEKFKGLMFAVCLRYAHNRADAEDMLQEAFIKVYRDLGQYQPYGSLGGWIRTVVVHTALEHLRKQKRKDNATVDIVLPIDRPVEATALEEMSAKELLQKIHELPEDYRIVFNLYAIEGYAHREIAEMLDISEANSKVRLNRARNLLKTEVTAILEWKTK